MKILHFSKPISNVADSIFNVAESIFLVADSIFHVAEPIFHVFYSNIQCRLASQQRRKRHIWGVIRCFPDILSGLRILRKPKIEQK